MQGDVPFRDLYWELKRWSKYIPQIPPEFWEKVLSRIAPALILRLSQFLRQNSHSDDHGNPKWMGANI
jgi:hypothetical protein